MTKTVESKQITSLNEAEIKKLNSIIDAGIVELTHIEDIQAALKDLVQTASEDLGIEKSDIMGAIKAAHKGNFAEQNDKQDRIFQILSKTAKLNLAERNK